MLVRIEQMVAPTVPLVTPDLARRHTRIDYEADDDLLALYIESATKLAEGYLNRSLINQTVRQTFTHTSPPVQWSTVFVPYAAMPIGYEFLINSLDQQSVDLFYGTVQSVTGITVQHWHDTPNTLDPATYNVDVALEPARIRLRNALDWNTAANVSVTYTAGYGAAASSVPIPIIHAVLLTVAQSYEHRGDVQDGDGLSKAARNLLDRYRQPTFGG